MGGSCHYDEAQSKRGITVTILHPLAQVDPNSSANAALQLSILHNVGCTVPNPRSHESQSSNPYVPPQRTY